ERHSTRERRSRRERQSKANAGPKASPVQGRAPVQGERHSRRERQSAANTSPQRTPVQRRALVHGPSAVPCPKCPAIPRAQGPAVETSRLELRLTPPAPDHTIEAARRLRPHLSRCPLVQRQDS